MKKKIKYTPGQLDFLRDGYLTMNVRELARAFNRRFGKRKQVSAILATLKNHRIRCGRAPKDRLISRLRLFTEQQARFIRENYAGRSAAELAALFNARFKTAVSVQQIKTFVKNRGIVSGRSGHFPRGHKPWNAGTKGQGLTGANEHSFKKGNTPANRKPLGSERICPKDGFVLIKIAERNPYTGFATRYKHKHVHVWEQLHGPVPKGMVVAFRDGDKTNIVPENLMLVSRAELLRLNKHGYKQTPEEIKASLLALARLEVKTYEAVRKSKELSKHGLL